MDSKAKFLNCPEYIDDGGAERCKLPAGVEFWYTMESSGGPVESARIRCPRGHWFNGPVEFLTFEEHSQAVAAPQAETSGVGGRRSRSAMAGTLGTTRHHPGGLPGMPRRIGVMRYESSVTSLSWIPSEAVPRGARMAFDSGFTHYDGPPPAVLGDINELRAADRFRFANLLRTWIDVDAAGQIIGGGYSGGGLMGSTTIRLAGLSHTFQAVALPDIQHPPERGESWMRFVQTTGGRTALPAPRPVRRRPFIQWQAPLVWTTLSLTLHADGWAEYAVEGASRFPRHWIYDADGQLAHKSGLTDFADWVRLSFGRHTPWGHSDSPALVTAVETALERTLSAQLMHGDVKPRISHVKAGTELVRQGEPGGEIYLVLDGVVRVERDGNRLAEYGPGAMLGERAQLEQGTRTSTLVAVTPCRVASVHPGQFDQSPLAELAAGHRREGAMRS